MSSAFVLPTCEPYLTQHIEQSCEDSGDNSSAEGAIEGVWEEYIVSSPFATEFKYSRFDATAAKPRDVSALTGVKTAWRSVEKQMASAAKTLEATLAPLLLLAPGSLSVASLRYFTSLVSCTSWSFRPCNGPHILFTAKGLRIRLARHRNNLSPYVFYTWCAPKRGLSRLHESLPVHAGTPRVSLRLSTD
eukprot:6183008-Pleurochrysis_carterae.AAC.2